jgi:hypothetical protein
MNEHKKPRRDEELRERWIESLLASATSQQDHTDRIARAMRQLESQPDASRRAGLGLARSRIWIVQWGGAIGVAASVLLALFLLVQTGGPQFAMAAIQRSLNVAAQPTTRKYLLQIESQSVFGGMRKTDIDLYVNGNDRFALRHPGPLPQVPQASFWVGQDRAESWVVPPIGPVLKGDRTLVGRWIRSREELDETALLHVTTVLTRMMSRGYRLEKLADEEITIPLGSSVECQHIRAEREAMDQEDVPDTIELWASRESGMAMRIIARWEREDGEVGKKSVVLTFQNDEPSLAADWYTAETHYQGHRPIIRMDSSGN